MHPRGLQLYIVHGTLNQPSDAIFHILQVLLCSKMLDNLLHIGWGFKSELSYFLNNATFDCDINPPLLHQRECWV